MIHAPSEIQQEVEAIVKVLSHQKKMCRFMRASDVTLTIYNDHPFRDLLQKLGLKEVKLQDPEQRKVQEPGLKPDTSRSFAATTILGSVCG